jgi:hypothetical protein
LSHLIFKKLYIFIFQVLLGIGLFCTVNWIGKHSYSLGYMELSLFVRREEAPAFNVLIRVFIPIVYLIITSSIIYYLNLDQFVRDFYLVNIYYIIFRLLHNIVTNRATLLNWKRQALYWTTTSLLSYLVYNHFIKVKANILPDFKSISNEIWFITLIFLYQIANNLTFSQEATIHRKETYIKKRYNYFKSTFGTLISELTQNHILESIVYAILIYEDFNRPKIVRLVENISFRFFGKAKTLGVMQVRTDKLLTDLESVNLGTHKIVAAYKSYIGKITNENPGYDWEAKKNIISDYNLGSRYYHEVSELADLIKDHFYGDSLDELVPKNE